MADQGSFFDLPADVRAVLASGSLTVYHISDGRTVLVFSPGHTARSAAVELSAADRAWLIDRLQATPWLP